MDTQQPLCAWCNKVQAGKLLDFGLISHGICPDCAERQMREMEIAQLDAMWHAASPDALGPPLGILAGLIGSAIIWSALAILWRVI